MRRTREILRLRWDLGLPVRAVAESVGVAPSTVSDLVYRAKAAGLTWPLSEDLSDETKLEALLYPPAPVKTVSRPAPDFCHIQSEMKKKGVTLQILWEEYVQQHPAGYRYARFCDLYRAWEKTQDVVLRQNHKAGEKLFIDFAGVTVPIVDPETGEVFDAQIFVATLGASSYTYVEALRSQDLESWIAAHVHAFSFFGGVTKVLVPDNLKSGVIASSLYEPALNRTYEEMARHYGCAIVPARARKPRDKAKVENGVQRVEQRVLAPLRKRIFFSLEELNEALWAELARLNQRPFQKREGSRLSLFEELDKPALRPLPKEPYIFARWKTARVHPDYHVEVEKAFYSVPYTLVRQTVEVCITSSTVEIFHRGMRVATHRRLWRKGHFSTVEAHRPPAHSGYLAWDKERFGRWAQGIGPSTATLVQGLFDRAGHPDQAVRKAFGVLGLARKYSPEQLEKACTRAVALSAFSYHSVLSILEKGLADVPLVPPEEREPQSHPNVRGSDYFAEEGPPRAH